MKPQASTANIPNELVQLPPDGVGQDAPAPRRRGRRGKPARPPGWVDRTLSHLGPGDRSALQPMLRLFEWAQDLRCDDGRYITGMVHPQRQSFPVDERSTYTAAAAILASDALVGATPAAGLFADHSFLPPVLDIDDMLVDDDPDTLVGDDIDEPSLD